MLQPNIPKLIVESFLRLGHWRLVAQELESVSSHANWICLDLAEAFEQGKWIQLLEQHQGTYLEVLLAIAGGKPKLTRAGNPKLTHSQAQLAEN